jgi:formylmethanofuran dehydrogenase subunit E
MSPKRDEYSKDEILSLLKKKGLDAKIIKWFDNCIDFHTYPAPGLLIGVFMVDYALELLKATPEEKLYAVCETAKCAPDPIQVIARCTTGNSRLKIINIGRFALTLNRMSVGDTAEAVRVYLDPKKFKDAKVLEAWFANTPSFDGHTMMKQLIDEIIGLGRDMLSFENVRVKVTPKQKWKTGICSACGEQVPQEFMKDGLCLACGPDRYYEKVT